MHVLLGGFFVNLALFLNLDWWSNACSWFANYIIIVTYFFSIVWFVFYSQWLDLFPRQSWSEISYSPPVLRACTGLERDHPSRVIPIPAQQHTVSHGHGCLTGFCVACHLGDLGGNLRASAVHGEFQADPTVPRARSQKKGQDPPLENAEGFARVTGYKELDKSLAFASVQRLQMNYLPEMQKLYSSMFSFYP